MRKPKRTAFAQLPEFTPIRPPSLFTMVSQIDSPKPVPCLNVFPFIETIKDMGLYLLAHAIPRISHGEFYLITYDPRKLR